MGAYSLFYIFKIIFMSMYCFYNQTECMMNYEQRFMTLYRRQGTRSSPRKRNAKQQNGCLRRALQKAVKRREAKSKGDKVRYTHLNAEFQKKQQGEIRNPSTVISTKEQRKTTEWEGLEISSRKLEIPREHFYKDGLNKGQKWNGPNRSGRY